LILKFIAFVVVLFLIYIVFFKKNREIGKKSDKQQDTIEDIMVECPTCSTYISKDEAILSNGKFYCSKECIGQ